MSLNIDIIDKVISRLEKEPEHFSMAEWAERTRCGTVCCLAGWATIEAAGVEPSKLERAENDDLLLSPNPALFWSDAGREALGLTHREANHLFHEMDWPEPYQSEYRKARTKKARAAVAIRLLREVRERGVWWAW